MSNYIDVQVLNSDGDPVAGVPVEIYIFTPAYTGKGGGLESDTDEDGHANFETAADYGDFDRATLKIYVKCQEFGPYYLDDAYTVTLDPDDDD